MSGFVRLLLLALVAVFGEIPAARAQNVPDYEKPPINYSAAVPRDAAARVQQRLAAGTLTFTGSELETLRAVLRELEIPVASQVVVFSKTSLQRGRIRPSQPRALYFSDSAYVGWVPGGLIEIAAVDPELGPVFYTFDPRTTAPSAKTFVRDPDCLRCHGGTFVRDVPGVFARTVFPNELGEPLLRHGSEVVDDETPFEKRWGGWFVTGYTGTLSHRGNTFAHERGDTLVFELSAQRPAELSSFFDVSRYPAPTSDVVALLVFEHQMSVQNALTHAGHAARRMLEYQRSLQKAMNDPLTDEPTYDSVKSVFASAVENVLDRLLFRAAAPLPEGVVGSDAFREAFLAGATRTRRGDSLKDFQLRDRLFAYRCSYTIYSEAFAALPPQLKSRLLDRLRLALEDDSPANRYAYLPKSERHQIYQILLETLPAARERWSAAH